MAKWEVKLVRQLTVVELSGSSREERSKPFEDKREKWEEDACCTSLMVASAMDSNQYVVHQVHAGRTSHSSAKLRCMLARRFFQSEFMTVADAAEARPCKWNGRRFAEQPCIPCLSYIPFLCDRPSTYDACTNKKCDP